MDTGAETNLGASSIFLGLGWGFRSERGVSNKFSSVSMYMFELNSWLFFLERFDFLDFYFSWSSGFIDERILKYSI